MRYNNLNEFKKHTIDYLKSIVANKHNEQLIEVIKESGYLAAEKGGEIRIYLDKEKKYNNSIHLAYVEIIDSDGATNNRYAKEFIKNNSIQDLLNEVYIEIEKDNLKLQNQEQQKPILINLGSNINDYLNNQSIEIKNLEIRYSDYNKEYYLDFSTNIGNNYFMIDFKIENNKIVYNDKYKEIKQIFDTIEDAANCFKAEVSGFIENTIKELNTFSIIENNFKQNIDKKILFSNNDNFYTVVIDNQYITLYKVDRKKEKHVYEYIYLKQFIDRFIKDNIDKFYIIDDNTDLSVKNLRSIVKGNNYINIYAA